METKIPIKITIQADHLGEIPNHKLSKIAEKAANLLQRAFVVELLKDGDLENFSEEQKKRGEYSFEEHFLLEWSQPKEFQDHENELSQHNGV